MGLRHSQRTACGPAVPLHLLLGLLIAASVEAADEETTDTGDEPAATVTEEEAIEEEAIEVPVVVEATEIEVQPGHVRFDAEFIQAMPGASPTWRTCCG